MPFSFVGWHVYRLGMIYHEYHLLAKHMCSVWLERGKACTFPAIQVLPGQPLKDLRAYQTACYQARAIMAKCHKPRPAASFDYLIRSQHL